MSAQHTPGPWQYVPQGGGYSVNTVTAGTEERVAQRIARTDDARLIAAAPDGRALALKLGQVLVSRWQHDGSAIIPAEDFLELQALVETVLEKTGDL